MIAQRLLTWSGRTWIAVGKNGQTAAGVSSCFRHMSRASSGTQRALPTPATREVMAY